MSRGLGDVYKRQLPYPPVTGMKDMRPVLMHVDAIHGLRIDITANVRTFVYNQTFISFLMKEVGHCGSKETRTDDKVVVLIHYLMHPIIKKVQNFHCYKKEKRRFGDRIHDSMFSR